ncbi:MAG: hypothetical protein CMO64_05240 [Verrucomicrobiales bacterium]|nr:hypothetical protein [Verrucomicrobiales bacterium]
MNDNERFEELLGQLLDGDISNAQLDELSALAATPGKLEEIRRQLAMADQLSQSEDQRRTAEVFLAGLSTRMDATAEPDEFVEQVMESVTENQPPPPPENVIIEPEVVWMGSGRFWAIAASLTMLLVAGGIFFNQQQHRKFRAEAKVINENRKTELERINSRKADARQATLFAPKNIAPGMPAAVRVAVRDGEKNTPAANADVQVSLVSVEGDEIWMVSTQTDDEGFAQVSTEVPADLPEGEYKLRAMLPGDKQGAVEHTVQLNRSFRVLLTSDKPMYQPGQKIHIRTLSLANAGLRPEAGRKAVIEVQDAKGNKVFKRTGETSAFGIFAKDFELADQVNLGSYTIFATVGDTTSERTVRVERYKLPRFKIDLGVEQGFYQPGQLVKGTISAQYTFGKPVAGGKFKLTASEFIERFRAFETIEGELNAAGEFDFEFRLKSGFVGQERNRGDAFVSLKAEVVDAADHKLEKSREVIVTKEPIRIEVFPESGALVRGVENTVYILTAYPDGRPAKTKLTIGRTREKIETSSAGIAKVKLTPVDAQIRLRVGAEDARGVKAERVATLRIDRQPDAFLMRTDKAVYQTGDTAKIDILSPSQKGRIFIDVVRGRRAVLMKTVEIEKGRGALALDLPADLFGTLELRGYRIRPDGNIGGDTKVIQVRRADRLKIEAKLDKDTYRPGEKAILNFIVRRGDGQPAQAALGLAGVDEAVFALSEMRPGLERVYFAIQEEILKPRFQLRANPPVQPRDLIEPAPLPEPDPDIAEAAVVLFAAAEGNGAQDDIVPLAGMNFDEKKQQVRREKNEAQDNLEKSVREEHASVGARKQLHERTMSTTAVLSPFAILFLLLLPILVCGVLKFRHRQPADLGLRQTDELRRAMRCVNLWWILGITIPLLVAALALWIYQSTRNEALAYLFLGFALFDVIAVVGLLAWWVNRAKTDGALETMPLFRKALAPLPWAFLLAMGGAIAVAVVAAIAPRSLDMASAGWSLLGVYGLLALVAGALAVTSESALEKINTRRAAWLGFSRTALVALPLLLVAMFVNANGGVLQSRLVNSRTDKSTAGNRDQFNNALRFNADDAARGFALEGMDLDQMAMGEETMEAAMPEPQALMAETAVPTDQSAPMKNERMGPGGAKLKAPTRVRRYFPETLLWKPELITDDKGTARLDVPLADSITTWRLAMSAVSQNGELGSATTGIRVFQDFFVDIDFPVALTQHDQVSVPVAVFNYLEKPQTVKLELQAGDWYRLHDEPTRSLEIAPNEVKRVYFTLEALKPGSHALTLKAFGSEMADAVERRVRVEPDGRRHEQVFNGRLNANLNREFTIPANAINGANDLFVKVYPGAFSQVVEGLDGIFRMPHGCFEQTSSTTYPNILVLDYMIRNKMTKPEIELKARNFINIGYQRLLSYEVRGGGFEWFGKSPAHNVLTAYGLMEFADMAKVHDVDPKVIERTRNWLMSQQAGDGSWTPTQGGIAEGAINAFRGAKLRTTAYIAWALAESGPVDPKLTRAMDYIAANMANENDNYTLGLCANALAAAQRKEAEQVINRLETAKIVEDKLAHWKSAVEGVMHGRGGTQEIETTAIIAQAFLKARRHTAVAHQALAWLIAKKDARGTWHSTSATVHAMRALLAGTDSAGGTENDLTIEVIANGEAAQRVEITPDTSDVFRLISLRHLVKPGRNTVVLEPSGKGNLAYQIVGVHYEPWADSGEPPAQQPPLTIDVAYDTTTLKKNDTLGVNVTVAYHDEGNADMTLVDLGIPPGFQVLPEYFQGLKDEGLIERFNITGRQVTLYFRQIENGKPVQFEYELKAKYPVKAKAPKSVAYQYYEPEVRAEAAPVELLVE